MVRAFGIGAALASLMLASCAGRDAAPISRRTAMPATGAAAGSAAQPAPPTSSPSALGPSTAWVPAGVEPAPRGFVAFAPAGASRLKDLMRRFLAGEISAAEYQAMRETLEPR